MQDGVTAAQRSLEPPGLGSNPSPAIMQNLKCPCGAKLYSINELIALSENKEEMDIWKSILSDDALYCAEEDDILSIKWFDEKGSWKGPTFSMPS